MTAREEGWKSGDDGIYEVAMTEQERLDAAADVVRSQQARLTLANSVIESLKETIQARDAQLMHLARFETCLARKLAEVGSSSHSYKNEAILSVVADLLGNAQALLYSPENNFDQIPF